MNKSPLHQAGEFSSPCCLRPAWRDSATASHIVAVASSSTTSRLTLARVAARAETRHGARRRVCLERVCAILDDNASKPHAHVLEVRSSVRPHGNPSYGQPRTMQIFSHAPWK